MATCLTGYAEILFTIKPIPVATRCRPADHAKPSPAPPWILLLLSAYLKLEWTKLDSNLQMVCSVDKDGSSNFSKLFTMTDLIGSVGSGTYQANQADLSLLNGTESTNALLQKMLEEGRFVVQ